MEIKGNNFSKNAKVKIGGQTTSSVKIKDGDNTIVAKFCMENLLEVKTDLKRSVSVTNPNAEKEKAKKKINLGKITYKFESEDFALSSPNRALNIQKALVTLGFLNCQYTTNYYGPITKTAVAEFQKKYGLPETGYFDLQTENKLLKVID